jgi:hypothetical protein
MFFIVLIFPVIPRVILVDVVKSSKEQHIGTTYYDVAA